MAIKYHSIVNPDVNNVLVHVLPEDANQWQTPERSGAHFAAMCKDDSFLSSKTRNETDDYDYTTSAQLSQTVPVTLCLSREGHFLVVHMHYQCEYPTGVTLNTKVRRVMSSVECFVYMCDMKL